jgi:hypothetical protein
MRRLATTPRMAALLSSAGVFLVGIIILAGSAALRAVPGAKPMAPFADQNPQGTRVEPLVSSTGSVELASGPVSVTLSAPIQQGNKLASRLGSLAPEERIYLVLRDMATQEQPGVLYHIYLDLPAGSGAPAKDDPHYVGVLNFYNARAEASPGVFRSFEVTELLRNLQKQGLLSDQTTVTIIPSRSGALNTNAKPVIGRVELVVQSTPS